MNVTQDEIVNGLGKLGLGNGDLVTLHSSLKSLGHVEGGGQAVIRALLETIGPQGTILMPAFSFPLKSEDEPIFDVRETPSCVGLITRGIPAGVRHASQHPSKPFLFSGGPRSLRELTTHPLDITPCGEDSPLGKFLRRDGKILLLGVGYNSCTAFHVVEERMKAPYMRFKATPEERSTASTGKCFRCRPEYLARTVLIRFHHHARTNFARKA